MGLSLNDVIKKIVESEKEKNDSIRTLKSNLQRKYEKYVKSKDEEKKIALKSIEEQCFKIIDDAKAKSKTIISSTEDRKLKVRDKYRDLISKNSSLAKRIAISLLGDRS